MARRGLREYARGPRRVCFIGGNTMPKIFTTLDKIKPAYDITYKVVL